MCSNDAHRSFAAGRCRTRPRAACAVRPLGQRRCLPAEKRAGAACRGEDERHQRQVQPPVSAGREERAGVPQRGPLLRGAPLRLPREEGVQLRRLPQGGDGRRSGALWGRQEHLHPAGRAPHPEARPDPERGQLRGWGPGSLQETQVKPVIHSRINVSARFRKPILEPCAIFLIANGDLINPASRLLIPRKALNQWDHVLQMVTEKITLRSGAVHRLYTLEGKLVESGAELENGQFYVAVGRDKFKKLPYSELLFDKSTMRRSYGQKASSLPPIVGSRKSKGSGNDRQSKSTVGSSDNSSPQPPKRKGKKEDVNSEKPTKGKQTVKLKSSPQTIPNSDEGVFKAGEERSETRGAAEVQEDEDTQVEIPVDQRPAEIVDEEDREKEDKEVGQKEDFSGMNGGVEEEGGREAPEAPERAEEILDHREEQAGPAHVNRGTNEENGEELDQVNNELQEAVEEEIKSQGAGSGCEEADLDPQRPPKPEVKITSSQENDNNEQNKDNLS
ncbi:doublecortin domain-containing protein 2 isoform 1-T1 [Megaptera novaeangliae]